MGGKADRQMLTQCICSIYLVLLHMWHYLIQTENAEIESTSPICHHKYIHSRLKRFGFFYQDFTVHHNHNTSGHDIRSSCYVKDSWKLGPMATCLLGAPLKMCTKIFEHHHSMISHAFYPHLIEVLTPNVCFLAL